MSRFPGLIAMTAFAALGGMNGAYRNSPVSVPAWAPLDFVARDNKCSRHRLAKQPRKLNRFTGKRLRYGKKGVSK